MGQNEVSEKHEERANVRVPLEKVWEFDPGAEINSTLVANGMILFGSADERFYALDAESGRERWRCELGTKVRSAAKLLVADDNLYVCGEDKTLYAIDVRTGEGLWQFSPGENVWSHDMFAVNGIVYCIAKIKNDRILHALYAQTGLERWRYSTRNTIWTPTVDHGKIFFGTRDKRVFSLDASTGERIWESTSKEKDFSRPVLAYGRVLIYGGNNLYAFNVNDGTLLWEVKNACSIRPREGPTVFGNHALVPKDLSLVELTSGERTKVTPGTDHEIVRVEEGIAYTKCLTGVVCAIDLFAGEMKWHSIIETSWPHFFSLILGGESVFLSSDKDRFGFNTSRITKRWEFPEAFLGDFKVVGEMVIVFPEIKRVCGYTSSEDPAQKALLEIGSAVAPYPRYAVPVLATGGIQRFFGDSGQIVWPGCCCLCLGPAEKHVTLAETMDRMSLWVEGIPYCGRCYEDTMKGLRKKEKPGVQILRTQPPTFAFRNERYWAKFMEANRAR